MGSWVVRVTIVLALLAGGLVRTVDSTGEPLPRVGSLESRLSQIADEATADGAASALQLADDLGVPVAAGRVRVVLQPAAGNEATARAAVTALGGIVEADAAGLVQALVPGHALRALPGLAGGAVVRAPLTPQPAAITGEGVAFTKADVWHRAALDGSGTDVAVIDLGFAGLAARQAEGEVPASAVNVNNCSGRWESTDHGVAVAEVVHEVAPGARLHLICVGTEIELNQALDYVVANGIPIVNHSVIWFASSRGDGQGPPGSPEHTVARARAAGVLWVNAAGNAGEKHWSGPFTDADADGLHEFASGDERNRVTLNPGRLFCSSLKWDEWPATDENFDLYVRFVAGDAQIASSTTVQNGSQMPREEVCWQNTRTGSGRHLRRDPSRRRSELAEARPLLVGQRQAAVQGSRAERHRTRYLAGRTRRRSGVLADGRPRAVQLARPDDRRSREARSRRTCERLGRDVRPLPGLRPPDDGCLSRDFRGRTPHCSGCRSPEAGSTPARHWTA